MGLRVITMPIYYRNRKTRKIEAKYSGCDTKSSVFRNRELYERFESPKDLPLEVQPAPGPAELVVPVTRRVPDWSRDIKDLKKRVEKLEKRKPVIKEVVKEVPVPGPPAEVPPAKKKPLWRRILHL